MRSFPYGKASGVQFGFLLTISAIEFGILDSFSVFGHARDQLFTNVMYEVQETLVSMSSGG